jgi:acyl transferase domain-containing protein
MAWVFLPSNELEQLLKDYEGQLWISSHTSPFVTMLSGDAKILKNLLRSLRKKRVSSRLMRAPGAGHTPQVDPLARELVISLQGIQPQRAVIPMVSTVTGTSVVGTEYTAEYWGRQLRDPIFFAEAMDALVAQGHTVFVEISADAMLTKPILHSLKHRGKKGAALASLNSDKEDRESMIETLNRLYDVGVFPVAEPATAAASDSLETGVIASGRSVIYLTQKPREKSADPSAHKENGNLDRRSGRDGREVKLPANVIEIQFGKERRSEQDRRNVQERRVAVGE